MGDASRGSVRQIHEQAWRSFAPGRWKQAIDLRDFIVRNVVPYSGDESFLASPSARTKAVWDKLQPFFKAERTKGVLDVDAAHPSDMLAHGPSWIEWQQHLKWFAAISIASQRHLTTRLAQSCLTA